MKFFRLFNKYLMLAKPHGWQYYLCGMMLSCMVSTPAIALEFGLITIQVHDNETNQPIPNVVIRLNASTPVAANTTGLKQTADIFLDHAHSDADAAPVFIRHIGQKIHFATNDNQRHHLHGIAQNHGYQFHLEMAPTPLSLQSIVIPTPHVIPLHCDYHANKIFGWLHISDTPWIAPTNRNGEVFFNVPTGQYTVSNWHIDLPNGYYLSNTSLTVTPRDFANTILLTAAKKPPSAPITPTPAPVPQPIPTTTHEANPDENTKKSRRRYHRR